MTIRTRPSDFASKYYVDVAKWLNDTGVVGSTNHEHMSHSYKKAAVLPILGYQFCQFIIYEDV